MKSTMSSGAKATGAVRNARTGVEYKNRQAELERSVQEDDELVRAREVERAAERVREDERELALKEGEIRVDEAQKTPSMRPKRFVACIV